MSANMFASRAVQLSMRRLAVTRLSTFQKSIRFASPAAIATGQIRQAATATADSAPTSSSITVSQEKGTEILAAQRRVRPVSPHLGIYKPQITWYPSMFNRITGVFLSGSLYIFGFGYLIAPYFGWHLESASMAAAFAAWPIFAKVFTKFLFAWPFTFHSFNGLRHLLWDTGATITNKQVAITGWTVVGLSAVTALGLTFL